MSDAFVCLTPFNDKCPSRCPQEKELGCSSLASGTEWRMRAAGRWRKELRSCSDPAAAAKIKRQPWLFQPCWKCAFVTGYAEEEKEEGGKQPTV